MEITVLKRLCTFPGQSRFVTCLSPEDMVKLQTTHHRLCHHYVGTHFKDLNTIEKVNDHIGLIQPSQAWIQDELDEIYRASKTFFTWYLAFYYNDLNRAPDTLAIEVWAGSVRELYKLYISPNISHDAKFQLKHALINLAWDADRNPLTFIGND